MPDLLMMPLVFTVTPQVFKSAHYSRFLAAELGTVMHDVAPHRERHLIRSKWRCRKRGNRESVRGVEWGEEGEEGRGRC